MSTGVVYALPLAGIGGFTITAESVEADNLLLYPGVGDTSELSAYPQTITELQGPILKDLTVSKTIDLGATPGLSGNLRVSFVSNGETAGQSVLLKSSALRSREAKFQDFSVSEIAAEDPRGQFQIKAGGPVTLEGAGSRPVRIRAHYLATSSISLSNTVLKACYDPDDDGDYEYGPCDGSMPSFGGGDVDTGNMPPTPVGMANPNPASAGEQVTFDASSSYDADGSVQSYQWTFPDGSSASGESATMTFSTTGDKEVKLEVTDDEGETATDTVTVGVGTTEPDAVADADKTTVIPGETIVFDGSGSSDPDGSIDSYDWEFGDGAVGYGTSPTHSYSSTGDYTVELNVTDDYGMVGTDTLGIDVVPNEPPSVDATVDNSSPNPGETITFDATGSSDSTGDIVSYEWDFDGDGSTDATGATASHSYSSGGSRTATVTVTDSGGASSTASVTVDVNEAPTANATVSPTSGDEETTFTFDASGSSDPDGSIQSYEWEIEEDDLDFQGTVSFTETGETVDTQINVVDVEGSKTFTATLTVTDDDGVTSTDTVEYEVTNCILDLC